MNLSGGAGTRCSCSSFKRVLQCDAKLRNPMSLVHTFYTNLVLFCNHRLRDGCDVATAVTRFKCLKYQHYRSDCTGLDSSCGFEWVVTEVENSPSSPQSVSWLQSDMPHRPIGLDIAVLTLAKWQEWIQYYCFALRKSFSIFFKCFQVDRRVRGWLPSECDGHCVHPLPISMLMLLQVDIDTFHMIIFKFVSKWSSKWYRQMNLFLCVRYIFYTLCHLS